MAEENQKSNDELTVLCRNDASRKETGKWYLSLSFFLIWRFEVIVIITYYIPIGDISYFLVFTNVCL